jgi:hypothetical protein
MSARYTIPRYVVSKTASALGWSVYDRGQAGLSACACFATEAEAALYAARRNLKAAEFEAERDRLRKQTAG